MNIRGEMDARLSPVLPDRLGRRGGLAHQQPFRDGYTMRLNLSSHGHYRASCAPVISSLKTTHRTCRQSPPSRCRMSWQMSAYSVARMESERGYTDFATAIAKLLGFDLCPRLKNLRERRLYVPSGMSVSSGPGAGG